MQNIKKYIRSNRELQKENEILTNRVKTLLRHYCEALVEIEILTHQFYCSCFNENKKQRIKEKEEFYSELFF
jgi:hypothetical protein